MILSIIIPTYNGKKILLQALSSITKSIVPFSSHDYEVIIVDNGSQDGTKDIFVKQSSRVHYISLGQNVGFAKAVNIGVKRAKGQYILILNNDCYLEKDTIKKLFLFLEKHRDFVATQPIILKRDKSRTENIGYVVDLTKGKAKTITNYELEMRNYKFQNTDIFQNERVYGLSATCLLISKDVFLKIGMFDEAFHSYLEDVDLFIRLAKASYQNAPCLDAYAFHEHMATSSKMGSYKQWHDLTNWIRIIVKNYPFWFTVRNFPSLFIERLRNLNGYLKTFI